MYKPLMAVLGVGLLFSGCTLVQDLLPKPGTVNMTLTAPLRQNAVVIVSGSSYSKRIVDDGRGYKTTLILSPGTLRIRASSISGYLAIVGIVDATGNRSAEDEDTIELESAASVEVSVTYRPMSVPNAP